MTSCFAFSANFVPFEKVSTQEGNNLLIGSKLFSYGLDPFSEREVKIIRQLPPLIVNIISPYITKTRLFKYKCI